MSKPRLDTPHDRHDRHERHDGEPEGVGSPSPAVTPVPVQETNILQILEAHLPAEHSAVIKRVSALNEQLGAARRYQEQLERIAGEAGITLSPLPV